MGMMINELLQKVMVSVLLVFLLGISPNNLEAMQDEDRYASKSILDLQEMFYKADIDENINVEIESESVDEALKQIARETGLKLTYRGDIMVDKNVSLKSEAISVSDALDYILNGTGLDYFFSRKGYLLVINNIEKSEGIYNLQGSLAGTITDSQTGEQLIGATVYIEELEQGVSSDVNGEYTFDSLPSGEYTVRFSYIGYRVQSISVTIDSGENNLNIELRPDLFGLDEVVVTGVVGDTESKRLPFTVQRVTSRDLEMVPSISAGGAIRGKVPGVTIVQGSGEPGVGMSVLLRGATSISGSNEPLYIVDGVILGSDIVDVESLDIESVEVIKGAAAATLYGSRAANGVIHIRTKRGANMAEGATRITVRNEIGYNELVHNPGINQSHNYILSGDPENPWTDNDGNPSSNRFGRASYPGDTSFMDQEYPVPTYDHIDRFFVSKPFYTNHLSISRRMGGTNYTASFNNTQNTGIMRDTDGYNRKNLRLNLDSQIVDNLTTSASLYYARSVRDDVGGFTPFFDMLFVQPDVDLNARDENGRYRYEGDPTSNYNNPLFDVYAIDRTRKRNRLMGSADVRFNPLDWLELSGNFSYDRVDIRNEDYWPTWYNHVNSAAFREGGLSYSDSHNEAINASLTTTINWDFGDIATRSQFRVLHESSESEGFSASGQRFLVEGSRSLGATDDTRQNMGSSLSTIKAEGYYLLTNLDYKGKYIVDAMGRRDGSSLFGADERWHTYYRLSGAYRMAEEDWFDIYPIDEFKFRASIGTAGGRPGFTHQYETWSVSGSSVTKGNLGNRDLKPEFATEKEFGFELGLYERVFLDLTYANTVTKDQILLVPLVSYFGFNNQWQNAGTVESNTFEASLRAYVIQQQNTSLSFTVLFDRTRSTMTKFDRPDQLVGRYFFRRDGEDFGNMYGPTWITNRNQLQETLGGDYSQYFDRNDDGYMVPVGNGNTWRDMMWGETVVAEDGTELGPWGYPILNEDPLTFMGNTVPDFSLAFGTNFRYRSFSLYTLLEGQFGFDIYNRTRQQIKRDNISWEQDQRGKPDSEKKPVNYYQSLFRAGSPSSHYVEDGTYMKIREIALRYRLDHRTLGSVFGGAIDNISISLIGRNLFTITNYTGYDPEVGGNPLQREDFRVYPNFRTVTGSIEIQF